MLATYKPTQRLLILKDKKGSVIKAFSGAIAQQKWHEILLNTINPKPMNATPQWLENKIKELNDWLLENNEDHPEYFIKKQNRDYYVRKIIILEENQLETIKI
jgi:hypothetical protein